MTETQNIVERLVLGVCAASLSVNAWLLSNKLDHVYEAIKGLNDKLGSVAEDLAATRAEVQMHTAYISYLQQQQHDAKDK